MNADYYAQLDNLILEELNVKSIIRELCVTDKGKLELKYSKESGYTFLLNGELVNERVNKNLTNNIHKFLSKHE